MKNIKKMLVVTGIVALTSQIYLDIIVSHFKISLGIIFFAIFLYIYRELNAIIIGVFTGFSVYFLRVLVYSIRDGVISDVAFTYFPEIFFYIFYGVFFTILIKKNSSYDINKYFIITVFSDYFANLIEMYIRINGELFTSRFESVGFLLLVATIRSGVVWIVLNIFKYYKMLLLKEEHEERYKKLLLLTSRLKTEMYWAEKSMNNIESVMTSAYELYGKISLNQENETWADRAITIAKDVHEIKKEFGLVVRGVEEITENRYSDDGIYFEDIIKILQESMKSEISFKNLNIDLEFSVGENFFTKKHYYLMSIFRNLIMNSIDAIITNCKDKKALLNDKITFNHEDNESVHVFTITDTGCGIKQEDIIYIFSPGFSTKIDYNTGNINRGLGLSLVKDIVEIYLEGNIEVNSVEGKGTTFKISILKEILEEFK